jgi:hypothetical protein
LASGAWSCHVVFQRLDVGIISFEDDLHVTVGLADSVENFATPKGIADTVDDLAEFKDVEDGLVEGGREVDKLVLHDKLVFFCAAMIQSITKP